MNDEKLRLNTSLPFIRAMAELIAAQKAKDSAYPEKLRTTASLLASIEESHNLYLIPYFGSGIGNSIVPNERPKRIQVAETLNHLTMLRSEKRIEEYYRAGKIERAPNGFFIHEGGLVEKFLNPFLSETELVFGIYLQPSIIFPGGEIPCWSQREWGNIIAEWANSCQWHIKEHGPWGYTNFYVEGFNLIESFFDFQDEFPKVFLEKLRQQGYSQK